MCRCGRSTSSEIQYFVSRSGIPPTSLFCSETYITTYILTLFRGVYHHLHPYFVSRSVLPPTSIILFRGVYYHLHPVFCFVEYITNLPLITRSCWELTPSSASRPLAGRLQLSIQDPRIALLHVRLATLLQAAFVVCAHLDLVERSRRALFGLCCTALPYVCCKL